MQDNELVERYIYAVTKSLPSKTREDVAKELRSIISDMLDERCGELLPSENDVKVVLTELGTPRELAEKYNPDGGKCLIGGLYYHQYKLVLKIVLISVAFGLAVAGTITSIMNQEVWYVSFAQWISAILNSLASAFTFVTLLFAFFYHKGVKIDIKAESIDDLPPIPKKRNTISKGESISGIAISVIFAVVFLLAPQIFCVIFADSGTFIPVFNVEVIHSTWYLIVALAVIGIIRESIKLIDGRYTQRVMIVTIVADLMSVGLSFWWLMNERIMNTELISNLSEIFKDDSSFIISFISQLQYIFLGIIVFSLILDIISTVIKTERN